MKILIVDDEMLIVEQIVSNINWNYFGINEVLKAYGVREAMSICRNNIPDIIVCDIEMPQLTGMDFLKWLRENNIESEFIFLTCHESFEYATTAIHYNICSYLTKPFEESEIVEALLEAINKIDKNQKNEKYRQYEELWIKNQSSVYHDFWKEIILPNNSPKEKSIISEGIRVKGLDINADANYIMIMTGIRTSAMESSWNDNSYFFAFKQLATEVLTEQLQCNNTLEYTEGTFFHLIVVFDQDKADVAMLRSRCIHFTKFCKQYLNYSASCCISLPSPIQQLSARKEELDRVLLNFRSDEEMVIYQGDLDRNIKIEARTVDTGKINWLLENGDRMAIINDIKDILLSLSHHNKMDNNTMNTIHQDFLQTLYAYLKEHGILANQLYSDAVAQLLFKQADNSIFDMLKWVDYAADKAIQYVSKTENSDPIIKIVKDYIKEHYSEDIRRSDIAEMVFLTPNYFSKIFNEKTGVSITEYINNYRILMAKELLKDPCLSVSDIAVNCGFGNISYFSTTFKRVTGESPNEYRSRLQK